MGAKDLLKEDLSKLDLARMICYAISGSVSSPCVWGLVDNLTKEDFNLQQAVQWIWEHHSKGKRDIVLCPPPQTSSADIHYIKLSQADRYDFVDSVHRAGWPYVVNGLAAFDGTLQDRQPEVLLDTYLDRTFGWGAATLATAGVIPYKEPFIGILHHTFDKSNGPYNLHSLFEKPVFLESLPQCKCIITLSDALAEQVREALGARGFTTPVQVLIHPTEIPGPEARFSFDKWTKNPDKKLVQIGSWLRSAFAMYTMPDIKGVQKAILKAKEADHYQPPAMLNAMLQDLFEQTVQQMGVKDASGNIWLRELIEYIKERQDSVRILDRLPNEEYDRLLTENCAMLWLTSCSACNTVLECMARDSVLFVNRQPAVEELLGKDYPGFCDSVEEMAQAAGDDQRIKHAHEYMRGLNKECLLLSTFLDRFQELCGSL